MSLVFIVYLIGVLPNTAIFLAIFGFIGACILLVIVFFCTMENDGWVTEDKASRLKAMRKRALVWLWVPCLMMCLSNLVPSEKTMYTMAAVYAGQKIAETPEAQQIGNDAFDVLKGILAKAKRELAEETPKK